MKRAIWIVLLLVISVANVSAQAHPTVAPNPYKPVLDKLK